MSAHEFVVQLETGKELLEETVKASSPAVEVSELTAEILAMFGRGSPLLETEAESDEDTPWTLVGFDHEGQGNVLTEGTVDLTQYAAFRATPTTVMGR